MHSSAVWVEKVWDICLRTLQNCMLETYMDCPYYEQLQFIMDTRLQMLFTYAVSSDVRLVQKAFLDFHCGQLPNGLLPGKTPSAYCQVISTFSLHYAFALWEYVAHTGDAALGRKYRADIDRMPWWLLVFTSTLLVLLYAVEKRMTKKAAYISE